MARKKGKCSWNPRSKKWVKPKRGGGFKVCSSSDLKGFKGTSGTSGLGWTKGMSCKRFKRVKIKGYTVPSYMGKRCADYGKSRKSRKSRKK